MKYKAYTIVNDLEGELEVADLYYDTESREYSYDLKVPEGDTRLPFMFGCRALNGKEIMHPDSEMLEYWLSDRVLPPNRMFLQEALEANGLYEYDWRKMIKLNKGKTVSDYFSVIVHDIPKGADEIKDLLGGLFKRVEGKHE